MGELRSILVDQFDELFDGRRDVWGAIEGRCVRTSLTPQLWWEHLYGGISVGVYPLVHDSNDNKHYVKWGCTDIDLGYDKIALAKNMHKALKALGITSWVEKTKGKGFHIWVFCTTWVPAATMRNALLVAHQLAGVPPTEVNPKQVDASTTQHGLGNYVNVPYFNDHAQLGKRVVFPPGGIAHDVAMLDRGTFATLALAARNPPAAIEAAANLYVPPPPPRAVRIEKYSGGIDTPVRRLNGLAFTIFNDGPLEGKDRSSTLAQLAYLCADSGLSPGEALEVLADADRRWGKFSERPDCYQQLGRMIERAYG